MEVWGKTRFPPAEVAHKVKHESQPLPDSSEIPLGKLSDGGISGTRVQPSVFLSLAAWEISKLWTGTMGTGPPESHTCHHWAQGQAAEAKTQLSRLLVGAFLCKSCS